MVSRKAKLFDNILIFIHQSVKEMVMYEYNEDRCLRIPTDTDMREA